MHEVVATPSCSQLFFPNRLGRRLACSMTPGAHGHHPVQEVMPNGNASKIEKRKSTTHRGTSPQDHCPRGDVLHNAGFGGRASRGRRSPNCNGASDPCTKPPEASTESGHASLRASVVRRHKSALNEGPFEAARSKLGIPVSIPEATCTFAVASN